MRFPPLRSSERHTLSTVETLSPLERKEPKMDSIQTLRTYLIALSAILAIFAAIPGTALAINENAGSDAAFVSEGSITSTAKGHDETLPALMLKDALVLEEREGYNSEYIFGMTKGILNSTLNPALKPMVSLLTVPLDLVFLPFAALLGAL
jgi:hypothetical protein